jgi:putative membrane protein
MKNEYSRTDLLALDRSKLANERTFLAYFRTFIVFLSSGIAILKLGPLQDIVVLGYFLTGMSPVLLFIGLFRFYRTRRALMRYFP